MKTWALWLVFRKTWASRVSRVVGTLLSLGKSNPSDIVSFLTLRVSRAKIMLPFIKSLLWSEFSLFFLYIVGVIKHDGGFGVSPGHLEYWLRDSGSPWENIDFCLFVLIFEATNLVRSDCTSVLPSVGGSLGPGYFSQFSVCFFGFVQSKRIMSHTELGTPFSGSFL